MQIIENNIKITKPDKIFLELKIKLPICEYWMSFCKFFKLMWEILFKNFYNYTNKLLPLYKFMKIFFLKIILANKIDIENFIIYFFSQ